MESESEEIFFGTRVLRNYCLVSILPLVVNVVKMVVGDYCNYEIPWMKWIS